MSTGGLDAPELLLETHELSRFDSGQPSLDAWLRRRALANQASGASRCFVIRRGVAVVGFYTLSAAAVAVSAAPGRVRRNMPDPIPMILLGRLAVDRAEQGRGLGRALLRDAALRASAAAEIVAARGLLVQAIDDRARDFYLAQGFLASPADPMLLMVGFRDLAAALP